MAAVRVGLDQRLELLAGLPNVTKAEPTYLRVPISPISAIVGLPGALWTPSSSSSLSTKHLTFSQSVELPLRYGEPRRLQTMPSSPIRSAAANSASGVPSRASENWMRPPGRDQALQPLPALLHGFARMSSPLR